MTHDMTTPTELTLNSATGPQGSASGTAASPPALEPPAPKTISKMAAVRQALAEGILETTAIVDYVKQKFGLVLEPTTAANYRSQLRKPRDKDGQDSAGNGHTAPCSAQPAEPPCPTVPELLSVKKSLEEMRKGRPKGITFSELTAQVRELAQLAEKVGRVQRLLTCLEILLQLIGDQQGTEPAR